MFAAMRAQGAGPMPAGALVQLRVWKWWASSSLPLAAQGPAPKSKKRRKPLASCSITKCGDGRYQKVRECPLKGEKHIYFFVIYFSYIAMLYKF